MYIYTIWADIGLASVFIASHLMLRAKHIHKHVVYFLNVTTYKGVRYCQKVSAAAAAPKGTICIFIKCFFLSLTINRKCSYIWKRIQFIKTAERYKIKKIDLELTCVVKIKSITRAFRLIKNRLLNYKTACAIFAQHHRLTTNEIQFIDILLSFFTPNKF